jgi:hypothetical protein
MIAYINNHPGVRWQTMQQIADDFADRDGADPFP